MPLEFTQMGVRKNQPLSTTAAYFIPEKDIRKSWKLHPNISIEGTELSAIVKSTEWLKDSEETPTNAVILTDSKVSLQLIRHKIPKNYEWSESDSKQYKRINKKRLEHFIAMDTITLRCKGK